MSYTSFIQGLPVSGTSAPPSGTALILVINTNINYSSIPTNILNNINGINISSGYILTIDVNTTLPSNIAYIYGPGTLSINSGITLTQGGAITVGVQTVNVAGTWANAGYGITIPSGSTVTWNVSGSVTTTSTPGTMTVNGTVYWYGNNIFLFTMAGTGIYLGATSSSAGTATNTISLSSTAVSPNSGDGNAYGTGKVTYYRLSAISGSGQGKYYLQFFDQTAGRYPTIAYIYIGTTYHSYSISGNFNGNYTSTTNSVITVWNGSASAGTITLTGTAYV